MVGLAAAPTPTSILSEEGLADMPLNKTILKNGFVLTDGDNDGSNAEITMAITNYERQKRWREKNRAIYNLRRRNKRKQPVEETKPVSSIDELRQLVAKVSTEPLAPIVKPLVFRNDHGQVISETHWNVLQKRKQEAKDGGYELDDYSQ